MKTSKSEQKRRKKLYENQQKTYEKQTDLLHDLLMKSIYEDDDESDKKFNELCSSKEFQDLEDSIMNTRYDLYEEDIENEEYINVWGNHPLIDPEFKELYKDGTLYETDLYDDDSNYLGKIVCLAYDYNGDYYYKVKKYDEEEFNYIPVCNN